MYILSVVAVSSKVFLHDTKIYMNNITGIVGKLKRLICSGEQKVTLLVFVC